MGAQKLPKTSRGSHQKTLDMEHSAALNRLHASMQDYELAVKARDDIDQKVKEVERKGRGTLTDSELDELLRMKDTKRAIDKLLEENKQKCDEVEYYLKTGGILFNYYEIIDKGSTSGTPIDHKKSIATNKNSIMKYFMAGGETPRQESVEDYADTGEEDAHDETEQDDIGMNLNADGDEEEEKRFEVGKIKIKRASSLALSTMSLRSFSTGQTPDINHSADANEDGATVHHQASIGKRFQQRAGASGNHLLANDRASLLEKYLMHTDRDFIKMEPAEDPESTPCSYCGSTNRTVMIHDGYTFCNGCFTVEYVLVDHEKPSYKEPPKEITYFSYKRINHFNEWLNQVQGKETTEIPEEVYDKILLEIKKQKITNMASLTNSKVRDILKKLKINKYYEHVPHIINRLSGVSMPHITPELEERLRHMFCQIQVPFLKHSPPTRKNFLSYSYVLHKFMQLLEKDQYLNSFSLLKSRDKLIAQDAIWRKICEELGWEFIRSV